MSEKYQVHKSVAHHSYNFDGIRYKHSVNPANPLPSHWHEFYEISLMINKGESVLTNTTTPFEDAVITFCTPADIHGASFMLDTVEDFTISFSPNIITNETLHFILANTNGFSYSVPKDKLPFYISIFTEFENNYFKNSTSHKLYSVNIIEFLILNLISQTNNNKKPSKTYSSSVTRIIDYIRKNFSKNISLINIANFIHLSESYTSYIFHKETGKSITQYLSELRLEKAAHLLSYTTNSIAEISVFSGFNSIKTFQRLFKNHYGKTPSEYRKNQP